ncbi:glycosyltransferase [Mucilaginibacter sp. UR6-1]|uniref:glycosyltransferase n=1 Tax=Mucilaginibacter sp. UR6-1 TaxID=1435643 RepID=UPI001E33B461|nr:glycosyltransferase [Mucilaginibacter sp. UR6-1]MCC8408157.1 glycosyltransferase [Mucilaginibacter sp. UR6-1]
MKILHVISSMDPETGGVCEAVRLLADGLTEAGFYNEIASVDDKVFHPEGAVIQHALGPKKGPWYHSKQLLPWLLQNLTRFDVVIVHGLWLFHGYAVNKALRQLERNNEGVLPRFMVMPHGMLDPYFQRAKGRRLKALRNVAYWALIEKNVINNADELLFTCETELLLAREPFNPYKPKRESVVGLGVQSPPACTQVMTKAFAEKLPDVEQKPYWLFLSRLHEKKGADLLLQAYKSLAERVAATGDITSLPHLVIAGPGAESAYGDALQQIVKQSNVLKGRVHFPGMLSGDAKWGAFYGCEAFVLPSHQENFGIAVVEALACGKTVLISDQVNIWREINEAGAAIVADDTDEGTFNTLNKWYKLSAVDKEKMSAQAHACFEQYFSVQANIERFSRVLLNINITTQKNKLVNQYAFIS